MVVDFTKTKVEIIDGKPVYSGEVVIDQKILEIKANPWIEVSVFLSNANSYAEQRSDNYEKLANDCTLGERYVITIHCGYIVGISGI